MLSSIVCGHESAIACLKSGLYIHWKSGIYFLISLASSPAEKLIDDANKKRVLIIDNEPKTENKLAGRNIPWLKYSDAALLNTKELYYATQVVLTESAVKLLNEKYSS